MKKIFLPLTLFCLLATMVSSSLLSAGAADQEKWVEGVLAFRATTLPPPVDPKAKTDLPAKLEFGPWYTTAPIQGKLEEVLFPEKGIDLKAKGEDGKPLWSTFDLKKGSASLRVPSYSSQYFFQEVTSPGIKKIDFYARADDGVVVLLNGKKIFFHHKGRAEGSKQLLLQPGKNSILVRSHNDTGGSSVQFQIGTTNPNATTKNTISLPKELTTEFSVCSKAFQQYVPVSWFEDRESKALNEAVKKIAADLGPAGQPYLDELKKLEAANVKQGDPRLLSLFAKASYVIAAPKELKKLNLYGLRLAIQDLVDTQGAKYKNGTTYLKRLADIEKKALAPKPDVDKLAQEVTQLRQEALLANPLLDFQKLLLVKRKAATTDGKSLGLPSNWVGNCSISSTGYDNEIAVLSPVRPDGKLTTFFRPPGESNAKNGKVSGLGSRFVGDVDLNFDGDKMLFSMPNEKHWQVFEIDAKGENLRQVTQGFISEHAENYDPCYLPSGKIIFDSTAPGQGVPCIGAGGRVANLYQMEANGEGVRQLCFDQDHNWCPTVMENGRVMYLRWEYGDQSHYFSRIMMQMNPDGTGQMELYGSNSCWPNSLFYARPIPGHPTKMVGIVTGHHGVKRMGELVLFDTAKGRHEADGAIQRIPGYGKKVYPHVLDGVANGSWPKFLHPYPLSDKYFLVSMLENNKDATWGIYLVDIYDNMVKIKDLPGYALLEPVPFRATKKPPVIPERVNTDVNHAVAMITDVHFGPGLRGVPRGTIKKLRLFEPHFAYRGGGGGHINIGIDGPWDVHRILGEVPVDADGSASFKIPHTTPIALQPLDAQGRAVAVMRSWLLAQPGETISCIGCHERSNETPPAQRSTAMQREPSEIEPWKGPSRGFGFVREVQPVLDKYCVGCHDGTKKDRPDLRVDGETKYKHFTPSYVALHPYVRRPGPESDPHVQAPMEWHASTSELIQMLERGHHNVKLDADAWSRLVTWIDLNVPDKGTWSEHRKVNTSLTDMRAKMRKLYANINEDLEVVYPGDEEKPKFIKPEKEAPRKPFTGKAKNWPFTPEQAAEMIANTATEDLPKELVITFSVPESKQKMLQEWEEFNVNTNNRAWKGKGGTDFSTFQMKFVLIPAGEFVMGSSNESKDEYPQSVVKIEKPFYIASHETSFGQFQMYDPKYNPGVYSHFGKDHSSRGFHTDQIELPVCRTTWKEANDFCEWLAKESGKKVTLPTEAQWEWACRAGSDKPFYFGDAKSDFGKFANLADASLANQRTGGEKWFPRVDAVNDGTTFLGRSGSKERNAFGLFDAHGNLAEWTRSDFASYPYKASANSGNLNTSKVVRGGSWYDRPHRATSSFRLGYPTWQRVYNVGFRPIIEVE